MNYLGFKECLREFNKRIIPTYRDPKSKEIVHQIDHLYVTDMLYNQLENCETGSQAKIFGELPLSDHLPIIAEFS